MNITVTVTSDAPDTTGYAAIAELGELSGIGWGETEAAAAAQALESLAHSIRHHSRAGR